MKLFVICNQQSGPGDEERVIQLQEALQKFSTTHNVESVLRAVPLEDLSSASADARDSGAACVVAAGGDGTVSAVAKPLLHSKTCLAVIPMGTFNVFARDLSIPSDVPSALELCVTGSRRRVDVASLNGFPFLTQSQIGMYTDFIKARDEQACGRKSARIVTLLRPFLSSVLKPSPLALTFHTPEGTVQRRTPWVFVGVNPYRVERGVMKRVSPESQGVMGVAIVKDRGGWAIIKMILKILVRGTHEVDEIQYFESTEVTINSRRETLQVGVDGEILCLHSPLRYQLHPQALEVVVGQPETSTGA